jgi:CDP-diacylglycerol--serine O-phosphatidyltransferase
MEQKKRSIAYILPNIFTASSIFAGVLSSINSINSQYTLAAWLIIIALVFDGLDGRIARMTNTCSRFGVEFDSLADLVAFGVAPALLLYMYAGHNFGRIGIVTTALYVIFGAIRLARFNVMTAQTEPSVFIGVPIPTAAVFIATLILLFLEYPFLNQFSYLLIIASIVVSLLMVSNIRYPSFKKLSISQKNTRRLLILTISGSFVIFLYPIIGFAIIFTSYIVYGIIRALYNLSKRG